MLQYVAIKSAGFPWPLSAFQPAGRPTMPPGRNNARTGRAGAARGGLVPVATDSQAKTVNSPARSRESEPSDVVEA
jgi:hypothetical protein